MSYKEHTEKTALFDWIEEQEFSVFGTLKFTNGADVTDEHGERTVRAYFNALDRAYFGHAVENVGMRHKRIVLRHTGICSTNLHYHFLAKPLTDADFFIELAKKQWAKMSSRTIAANETQIERVRSTKAKRQQYQCSANDMLLKKNAHFCKKAFVFIGYFVVLR